MTPKEKAEQLIKSFKPYVWANDEEGFPSSAVQTEYSKECALIMAKEILQQQQFCSSLQYWYEVNKEIEKL